jgi:hypothetical protein
VARAGYAARGIIYLIVGALAALAALGRGGDTTDSRGALGEVLSAPFGQFLLFIVAAGLLCYSAWRATQSLLDADAHGTDLKGIVIRSSLAVSALVHVGLAFFALSLVFGWGTGSDDGSSSQEWTARLLSQPFGRWLVAGVGVAIIGACIAHNNKASTARFDLHYEMSPRERDVISPISRVGLFARGVVFTLIGGFFVTAAVQHDASEARGLAGALRVLQEQPFGWVLLGILALGLLAFGAYSLLEAVYRRITAPT